MRRLIYIILIISCLLFSGCRNPTVAVVDEPLNVSVISPIDKFGSIPVLTELQYAIHQEKAFSTRVNVTIGNGNTHYVLFKTDGKEIHFVSRRLNVIDLSNQIIDFEFKIYENVTVTNNGTELIIINLDRDSNQTNTLLGFNNPVGLDLTNSLYLAPFGNRILSDRKSSLVTSIDLKYIMKADTYYTIEMINNGIGNVEVEYDVIWIEEEKNK